MDEKEHESHQVRLDADRLLNLALVRLLEIIGEAASRVSREITCPLSWNTMARQIVGMRNRLIHGYDLVDFEILWRTWLVGAPPPPSA